MTPRSDRVAGQHLDQGLACVSAFNCGPRSEVFSNKKPFCAKKLPPFNCSIDWNKCFCCDSRFTAAGGLLDKFRRRRIDDRNNGLELREGIFQGGFPFSPRNGGRNKLVDVGRHRKMRHGVPGRNNRKEDPPAMTHHA